MTTFGKVVYGTVLATFAVLAALALFLGQWLILGAATLFAAIFALTAPFVLGRRWRPPPPPSVYPTRRPVRRSARRR